jgi:hypothetical protein
MWFGVQFRAQVPAGATQTWFTHSWPADWRVIWQVIPTWPLADGPAQLEWKIQTDRQATGLIKYFIQVRNLTGGPVDFESRFAVLN